MSRYFSGPDGNVHGFPDDVTQEEVQAALGSTATPEAPTALSTQSSASARVNPYPSFRDALRGRVTEMLPAAGGLAGGLFGAPLGVPGMIAGAGIGGAVGETLREAERGERLSPVDIAKQGSLHGVFEGVGGQIARSAGAVARPLMRRALGVGKGIASDFPDVAETVLENGIPVSRGGVAKADRLREESAQVLMDLLSPAKASGTMFKTSDIVAHAKALLSDPVLPSEEKARIAKLLVGFVRDHGVEMDPVLLKQVKQFYQTRASSVYGAAAKGIPTLAQENRALFSGKLAQGAEEALETIPGVAAREAKTQGLIGAQRAVEDAVNRPPRAIELHKPGSWPVPILNSPHALSRYALGLNSAKTKMAARQSPRVLAAILEELLHTEEPDATGASR